MTPILSGDNIHVENTGSGYRIHADMPPAPRNASPYEGFFALQLKEEKEPLTGTIITSLTITNNRAWINGAEKKFPDFKQPLNQQAIFCYLKSSFTNSEDCAIFTSTQEQTNTPQTLFYPLGKVEYPDQCYHVIQYNWGLPQLTILAKGFIHQENGILKALEPDRNGILVWTAGSQPKLTTLQLPSPGQNGMLKLTGTILEALPLPSETCILISQNGTSFRGFELAQKDGVLYLTKGNLGTLAISNCEG